MNDVMEKQIQAIRADFQSRIEILESQLQATGVLVAPADAPSNLLHRQHVFSLFLLVITLNSPELLYNLRLLLNDRLLIHLVVIPLFGQCHINNNLMHFHPKR